MVAGTYTTTSSETVTVLPGAVVVRRGRPRKGDEGSRLADHLVEAVGQLEKAKAEVSPASVLAALEGAGKAPVSKRALNYVTNQLGELAKLGRIKRVSRGRYGL